MASQMYALDITEARKAKNAGAEGNMNILVADVDDGFDLDHVEFGNLQFAHNAYGGSADNNCGHGTHTL